MNHQGTKLLQELKRAWRNENFAPLLLPYQGDLVDAAKSLVRYQEDSGLDGLEERNRDIAQKEIDRFIYILRSYLRKRLRKIECFATTILSNPELCTNLSLEEKKFADEYLAARDELLASTVLDKLPKNFQSMDRQSDLSTSDDMVPRPNLNTHVFCRVNEHVGNIDLGGGEFRDLVEGDLYVLKYEPVRHMVESHQIDLI